MHYKVHNALKYISSSRVLTNAHTNRPLMFILTNDINKTNNSNNTPVIIILFIFTNTGY